jgi:TetR/AcrR family tetracycline transcriptional repressor
MVPRTDRTPLTRELIINQAIEFVDERTLTQLSMRNLGKRLGVEGMSLYRYVNGREDLLEGMVDALVHDLEIDPKRELDLSDGWQAYLQWLAHGVRKLAHEHPNIFPLIATRHPAAPWIRPPLRSLQIVEDFLTALMSRGFEAAAAVNAYRVFSSFLLGHLLLETSILGAGTAPVEEPLDEGQSEMPNSDGEMDISDFPHVAKLREQLSEDHGSEEFERALEDLLDRLDLRLNE